MSLQYRMADRVEARGGVCTPEYVCMYVCAYIHSEITPDVLQLSQGDRPVK